MIKHLRVLVVDDDPDIVEVLKTFLVSRGYTVETANGGPEGLKTLDSGPFDLIITDIAMAGINGFQLLKTARERFPQSGIVLMTAYDERYPLSQALSAGADGYISKPFTLKKFSLIFERAYWKALSREDWWDAHDDGCPEPSIP